MIAVLHKLFEAIKGVTVFSLYLSYNTGKLIVHGLFFCYDILHKICNTLWTVIVIINEDLLVFLTDVWNRLCLLFGVFSNLTEYISDFIVALFSGIKHIIFETSQVITNIFYVIIQIITKTVNVVTILIVGIKHLIVLFGSGVWFVITVIPVFMIYMFMMTTYCIGRIFEELKLLLLLFIRQITSGIYKLTQFFTDIPIEAVAGLLICVCLIYTITRFHVILFSFVSKLVRYTLTIITRRFNQLKTVLLRRFRRGNDQEESDDDDYDDSDSNSSVATTDTDEEITVPLPECPASTLTGWTTKRERNQRILREELADGNQMCVICTDRTKCMLFMPCRHLSTCLECTEILLKNYQKTCPICRCFIGYTIHVY